MKYILIAIVLASCIGVKDRKDIEVIVYFKSGQSDTIETRCSNDLVLFQRKNSSSACLMCGFSEVACDVTHFKILE